VSSGGHAADAESPFVERRRPAFDASPAAELLAPADAPALSPRFAPTASVTSATPPAPAPAPPAASLQTPEVRPTTGTPGPAFAAPIPAAGARQLAYAPPSDPAGVIEDVPSPRPPVVERRQGGFGGIISRFMRRPKPVQATPGEMETLSVAERIARDFGNVADHGSESAPGGPA
jgi:hypothetical protein